MPIVKMLKTAASPERVLEAGKTYNISKDAAADLLADKAAVLAPETKPKHVLRVPAQPDPEDLPTAPDDDEDDDEDDEDADDDEVK